MGSLQDGTVLVSTPASSFLALVPGVALQGCLLLSTLQVVFCWL